MSCDVHALKKESNEDFSRAAKIFTFVSNIYEMFGTMELLKVDYNK